jgi:hypothetical protein
VVTSFAYALVAALIWPWTLWPLFKFWREGEQGADRSAATGKPLARAVDP